MVPVLEEAILKRHLIKSVFWFVDIHDYHLAHYLEQAAPTKVGASTMAKASQLLPSATVN